MKVRHLHEWPRTAAEAQAIQEALRPLVDLDDPGPHEVRLAAGLDVAYDGDRVAAAVVVLDTTTLQPVEASVAIGADAFAYVPGLFAFRELPPLVTALERLRVVPDLLVCDGHGIAHPRRFGLACHVGVLTDLPAIGVAKTPLTGSCEPPCRNRGSWTPLRDGNEVVGRALRTRAGVKPVFVSVGHRLDLDAACRHVLNLSPHYRLPETTRAADRAAREALAGRTTTSGSVRNARAAPYICTVGDHSTGPGAGS